MLHYRITAVHMSQQRFQRCLISGNNVTRQNAKIKYKSVEGNTYRLKRYVFKQFHFIDIVILCFCFSWKAHMVIPRLNILLLPQVEWTGQVKYF